MISYALMNCVTYLRVVSYPCVFIFIKVNDTFNDKGNFANAEHLIATRRVIHGGFDVITDVFFVRRRNVCRKDEVERVSMFTRYLFNAIAFLVVNNLNLNLKIR